jgi:chromosome segregation ATPase
MNRVIICPSCGLHGRIPEGFAEPQVQCPRCSTTIVIEGNAANPPPAPVPANPPRSAERAESLDELFARMYSQTAPPTDLTPGAIPSPPVAPPAAPAPPTLSARPADAQAEQQWLAEERQRLEAYMNKQFATLQRQREEFTAWRSQVEATLIAREQEVNRQAKVLTALEGTLRQREHALAERESAAVAEGQRRADLDGKLQELESIRSRLQAEVADQRALLERLRSAAAEQQVEAPTIVERRDAWEKGRAEGAALRQQLDQRAQTLEQAETALQQRQEELDEMETRLRRELGEWEQRLKTESEALEQQRESLQKPARSLPAMPAQAREDGTEPRASQIARAQSLEQVRMQAEGDKAILRAQLTTQAQELARLRNQATTQDQTLARLRSTLAAQSTELYRLRKQAGEQGLTPPDPEEIPPPSPEVEPLRAQLDAKMTEIDQLRDELHEQSQQVVELRERLADQDHGMDTLRAKLGSQSQEVERLRALLNGQNTGIDKLRAKLGVQSQEVERLRARLLAQSR